MLIQGQTLCLRAGCLHAMPEYEEKNIQRKQRKEEGGGLDVYFRDAGA